MNAITASDKFFSALRSADIDGMRSSVVGLNLNEYDEVGFTPLLTAVFIGDPTAVRILLEAGSDPNLAQQDDPSATPLSHAEEDFGLVEIADILREYGAVKFNPSLHTDAIMSRIDTPKEPCFTNPFFMGYLPFSFAGVLLIVAIVKASSSWAAILAGAVLIQMWSAIFLVLQMAIFKIRFTPRKRFLRIATAVSIFNLVIGVPLFLILISAVFRLFG